MGSFGWRAFQMAVRQGFLLLNFFLAAMFLDPDGFGVWNYVLAIVVVLALVADFGLSTAVSKYIGEWAHSSREKAYALAGSLLIGLTGVLLLVATLYLALGGWLFPEIHNYRFSVVFLLLLIPLTSYLDGVMRGLEQFRPLALGVVFGAIPALFLTYPFIQKFGPAGALSVIIFFYWLQVAYYLLQIWPELKWKLHLHQLKPVLWYAAILGLSQVSHFFYSRVDILFLGKLGYMDAIGFYEIANRFLLFLLFPVGVISQVITPQIARAWAAGHYAHVHRRMRKYLGLSACFAAGSVIFVLLVRGPFFENILPAYNVSTMHLIIWWMLPVFLTQITNGIVPLGFAVATGHARLGLYYVAGFGLLNVILDFWWIHLFGFMGVVYATVVVKCTADLLYLYHYDRILRQQVAPRRPPL
jgi:O-antigen/teichoic acid export membrane protein